MKWKRENGKRKTAKSKIGYITYIAVCLGETKSVLIFLSNSVEGVQLIVN